MPIINGVVEAKSNKFDKFSILVGDVWYSSKFDIPCNKGDAVEFDNGGEGKKWCQKLKVVSGGGGAVSSASSIRPAAPAATGFPVPMNTKDRSIVRQNALARGAEVACAAHEPGASAEDIAREAIRLARLFEDYTSGDADVREAKALTAATVDVAA
jgi:hypothetical protein